MADDEPSNAAPTVESPYAKGDETADLGDFVDNEDDQINLEDIAEPWHKYDIQETSRVFYPICLGEVLNDRYLVERKVDFGGFSTVWMAHDLQDKRDVALKVVASGGETMNSACRTKSKWMILLTL